MIEPYNAVGLVPTVWGTSDGTSVFVSARNFGTTRFAPAETSLGAPSFDLAGRSADILWGAATGGTLRRLSGGSWSVDMSPSPGRELTAIWPELDGGGYVGEFPRSTPAVEDRRELR